ncbi:ABC transporter permease [Vaginisenegalia massiliensis]|uniref:ABC transporter permease n=1 Tax=Vaginisenegalia massiliensis TaxID=2058294 RepID=UPI000F52EDD7|nr:ABC transporter permease [Vaginisenegalia massiliensis]
MTVFKAFLKHVYQQKNVIILYLLVMAAMLGILFAVNLNQSNTQFKAESLDIAYLDQAKTPFAKSIVSYLEQEGHHLIAIEPNQEKDARKKVFSNFYSGLVIIPNDVDQRLQKGDSAIIEVLTDQRDTPSMQIGQQLNKYFRFTKSIAGNQVPSSAQLQELKQVFRHQAQVMIRNDKKVKKSSGKLGVVVPFMGFILLSIVASAVGRILITMNRPTISQRVRLGAMDLKHYTWQILLGELVLGIFLWLIMMLICLGLGGAISQFDLMRYGIAIAIYLVFCLAFTYLLTSLSQKLYVFNSMTTVSSLALSFLSGIFMPYELFSPTMKQLAQISPIYYYNRAVSMEASHLSQLAPYWLAMAAFAVGCTILGYLITNQKQKKVASLA